MLSGLMSNYSACGSYQLWESLPVWTAPSSFMTLRADRTAWDTILGNNGLLLKLGAVTDAKS
jgi:hypothetical protein